ncbi:MAG: F-type H+-transporting ATPase subunit a [Clostridium sp.]|jgi:F-type H+-transporting ATPase subunit a
MGNVDLFFNIKFFGYNIGIAQSILVQWVIIVLVSILCFFFTRNLKIIPNKKQNIAEIVMESINKLVRDNMGEEYMGFVPFIGTIAIFLVFMNLTGLIGVKPPTADYSVSLSLSLITFFVVQWFAIKKIGLGNYFSGYAKPYAFILPINLIERVMLPVSLSLRLFGNMTAAVVIMELTYSGLGSLNQFAQLVVPIPVHLYFDLFDGIIQMIIFVMLTMVNIKVIAEH